MNSLISTFKTLVQPIANAVIGHIAGAHQRSQQDRGGQRQATRRWAT